MALIQWNDALSVGIAGIDQQHQRLVQMINGLNDAMGQGKGKDVIGRIIAELVAYAVTHFRTEEKYFDQFAYPDAANHKREHADFTKRVADFKAQFDAGKLGLSIEVMAFLSNWLQDHIKGSDRRYAPFLRAKAVA